MADTESRPDDLRRRAEQLVKWATVDIADQFQRFVRKPELDEDAQWVSSPHYDALLARVQALEQENREYATLQADIWDSPAKWMCWCDHRMLERAEAAEAKVQALEEERRPRACRCAVPDPVMQADGKFYCYTCSFETGSRPRCLEPESQLTDLRARISEIVEQWRGLAAHYRDICLHSVEDSDTYVFNMRQARHYEDRADDLVALIAPAELTQQQQQEHEQKDGTRVDGQPDSSIALPQRRTE